MYYLSAFGSFDCMWVLSGQIRIKEHNKAKSSIMISYLINLRVYYILYLYPSWPFRQFKCSFHIFQSFVNSKIHTGHFYYLPKFLVWSPFSSMRPHFHAGGADCQDGVILSSCHPVMLTVLDTGNFSKLTDTCFYAVCGENYNGFFHMTKHISNMIQLVSGKSESHNCLPWPGVQVDTITMSVLNFARSCHAWTGSLMLTSGSFSFRFFSSSSSSYSQLCF